jgi:hypothetical protein
MKMMFTLISLMCFLVIGVGMIFHIICEVPLNEIPESIFWFI